MVLPGVYGFSNVARLLLIESVAVMQMGRERSQIRCCCLWEASSQQ